MINFDVVIIGAGVIGLSIAKYLSNLKLNILILEKNNIVGAENSSRNTETIHAGIYYQSNSLKLKFCLRGKNLLYDFCQKYNIAFKKCGKIFIAQDLEEYKNLELLYLQAMKNGLTDLSELDKRQLKKIEPNIYAKYGLLSPSSGIFDSYNFLQVLEKISQDNENIILKNSIFLDAYKKNQSWEVHFDERGSKTKINSKYVINCAGLNALKIAKNVLNLSDYPNNNFTKGSYLRYNAKSPIQHIIYPAMKPGTLKERTDACPDIKGGLRFGPSFEKNSSIDDFSVSESLINKFYKSIVRFLPDINKNTLSLDLSGIRPKIITKNNDNPDFYINMDESGWINLFGIESPGLTSSLAIGEYLLEEFFEK